MPELTRFQHYIAGKFEDAGACFESLDPATGKPWALMPAASAQDVDRAVHAADAALHDPAWAGLTATARGKLLFRLGDLLAATAPRLAALETRDTGKIIRETGGQIAYIAEYFRFYAGLADKVMGVSVPVDKPDMDVTLRREPVGVVAAMVPWNSQLFLAAVKLGPALAAGCTVVLKAAEDGAAPLLEFARVVHEAGFPPGVVNIITGTGAECGQALTTHPLVSRIAFTGGPETARHIVRNSAANLAATTLELGGKSPVLAFDDADVDNVVSAVIAGIFAASGQSCVAGSRLLVQRPLLATVLKKLKARAEQIVIGDPSSPDTQMGPLATARQRKRALELIKASLEYGADLVTGGAVPEGFGEGFYLRPTILLCHKPETPCLCEEFFAPVLSVMAFDTEDEGLRLANDSKFGLASGLFTKDLARAHRLSRQLRAGVVWINTYRVISPLVPFGGYKESGLGREGGTESILDYTRTKSVWINLSDAPLPDPFVMR
ncbi:aldehyde dehydrogenase [Acidocella aminolytica]|jgi:acyl-CoA reductase-like NAD-dependent aldehyde dehydrogenase|uniref:Aldehyde dehydrogenase n=1 Tax=Acidocella aminolytica 101 = DSM 11237 TaxID=1120923 RepID=A0A0D6PCE3_9PROT|nr:aldehyde dehydrogenase [Acidocella aminolytica]GAN79430.1 aldehyde dehydrogenase [Acidocella aminolytica 101 = DSM 11237]GBQ43918.1 NAD-dependent aldehyde dehydrogenase [Acidocella aminolytica 101 = DSM 11237]SHE45715.1 aldehyde dehydrogenase (NAD+) [Acidocella aminolytica 101 = DSM 11237]